MRKGFFSREPGALDLGHRRPQAPAMSRLRFGSLALLLLLPFACKLRPSSFPDDLSVMKAQKVWCQAMAKYEAPKGSTWMHEKDCNKAFPAGSAQFVAAMATCYRKQHAEYEEVPDLGSLVANCTEEIMVKADPGDLSKNDLVLARCERQLRCSKVALDECKSAFNRVDGYAKAYLTHMYNLQAQAKIADCMRESPCGKGKDPAKANAKIEKACYKPMRDARVWLPLSLAPDTGLRPRVAD